MYSYLESANFEKADINIITLEVLLAREGWHEDVADIIGDLYHIDYDTRVITRFAQNDDVLYERLREFVPETGLYKEVHTKLFAALIGKDPKCAAAYMLDRWKPVAHADTWCTIELVSALMGKLIDAGEYHLTNLLICAVYKTGADFFSHECELVITHIDAVIQHILPQQLTGDFTECRGLYLAYANEWPNAPKFLDALNKAL